MSLEFGRHTQYLSVSILGGEESSAFLADGGWRRPRSGLQPSPWSLAAEKKGIRAALHEAPPAPKRALALGRRPPALRPAPRSAAVGGAQSPCLGTQPLRVLGSSPLSCLPFCVPGLHFCSPGWDAFQGACYKHFSTRRSWEEAENKCRMYGAHLASISTPEEQHFINSGLGTGREATLATCSLIHTFTHSSVSQLKSVLLTPLYIHSGTHYLVYLIHSYTFPSCLPPSHSTRGQWGFW